MATGIGTLDGPGTVNNVAGKTSTEMTQEETYNPRDPFGSSNWDFTNIWQIDEGVGYPYFQ